MREETRIALKMFVEKADKLMSSRYLRFFLNQDGPQISYHYERDKGVVVTQPRPDDEATDSFILTFRFFIQEREHVSFRWLTKHVLDDPGLSDRWKTEFSQVRDKMNTYLDSKTHVTERVVQPEEISDSAGKKEQVQQLISEKNLSYRDIMDIFMYGDAAHFEVSKKLIYERWKSNPVGFPTMMWEFDNLLLAVLKAINCVAALCREELARHNAGLPPS